MSTCSRVENIFWKGNWNGRRVVLVTELICFLARTCTFSMICYHFLFGVAYWMIKQILYEWHTVATITFIGMWSWDVTDLLSITALLLAKYKHYKDDYNWSIFPTKLSKIILATDAHILIWRSRSLYKNDILLAVLWHSKHQTLLFNAGNTNFIVMPRC